MNELHFSILLFILLAITFLIGEVYRRRFVSVAKKTRGTIIEIETRPTGDGDETILTVEYTTEKGRIYQYTSSYGYPLFLKRIGSQINIYYDPKQPDEEVMIGNPIVSFELLFGSMFLGYSIYLLIKYLK